MIHSDNETIKVNEDLIVCYARRIKHLEEQNKQNEAEIEELKGKAEKLVEETEILKRKMEEDMNAERGKKRRVVA